MEYCIELDDLVLFSRKIMMTPMLQYTTTTQQYTGFAPSGKITVTGFGYTYEFEYSYQPALDNVNGVTLQTLDRLRGKSLTTCC